MAKQKTTRRRDACFIGCFSLTITWNLAINSDNSNKKSLTIVSKNLQFGLDYMPLMISWSLGWVSADCCNVHTCY